MKICCYEKLMMLSSGTACISAVRNARRGSPSAARHSGGPRGLWPEPASARGGGWAPRPGNLGLKWVVWERDKSLYPASPRRGKSLPKTSLGGFSPVRGRRLLHGAEAAHPKVPFIFLSDAPFANATRPWEDGARSLSLAAFQNKSRGVSCWCPLSSCAADLSSSLSRRAGIETPAPCAEVLI